MRPTRHKGNRLRLHEKTLKTLGSGNMLDAVTIPPGEDEDEWLVRTNLAATFWLNRFCTACWLRKLCFIAMQCCAQVLSRRPLNPSSREAAKNQSYPSSCCHLQLQAMNTVDFFNELSVLFGVVEEDTKRITKVGDGCVARL